ncbi:phosphonate metabolism transcriptional regulator PhnF [Ottowia sp. VDI28]|uniref:phosphonate metabolism transcriptional regulator PhnF n=1 Tax=Ottowia sp. VDI28 TaxID=3133968 RepID=UPI003C2FE81B
MTRTISSDPLPLALPDPTHSFWARIAHEIADAIGRGVYAPGDRLPSEQHLATQYGVNRHTVRRSLATLGQLGLVRSTQGSGTYVEEFAVDLVLRKRTRYRQSLAQAGVRGGMRVLATSHEKADTEVAKALRLPVGKPVLHLVVLGDGGGQPLHVSDRYFPLPRFEGLDAYLQETGSITQSFDRFGITDYTRRQSRISARMPAAEVASHLQQPAGRPTLHVTSVNIDMNGEPIEYASAWFAGDRVTLTVDHGHDL